nr:reverse transcriptase [Tanacetum cinerariifolium]
HDTEVVGANAVESGDISILNSLIGHGSPCSLQLWGTIGTGDVHVLIDNGSTHNFVRPDVVERMCLPVQPTKAFKVYIGSEETLLCEKVCSHVSLLMQGVAVEVDLYVLPMQGHDVLLGIQWLQHLGKVTHDYARQTMEFNLLGTTFTLKGDESLRMKKISLHWMQALLEQDEVYGLYEIYHLPLEADSGDTLKKKDGSYRFCVDYRALNAVTIKDKFPIPTADDIFDELGGATIFTKLDLRAGYHQIRVHERDVYKMTFRTHDGHYEFLVMPFSLTNAPFTFQATMNQLFSSYLWKFVIVFYDILVYSTTFAAHLEHLECVLKRMQEHQFYVKRSKCFFRAETLGYLGHIISGRGVAMDPKKVVTVWECRSLPLNGRFKWGDQEATAFAELNQLTTVPILSLLNFDQVFVVEADVLAIGIGAVLLQNNHRISVFSRLLEELKKENKTLEELEMGGYLQPLPMPSAVWEDVSINFIIGLPASKGLTVILVAVDRFSMYAHFGPLSTCFNGHKVAEAFLDMVVKLHGIPKTIVSDRDPIFLSKFWTELFGLSGTQLCHSTAYHPQSDGQTKVVNRGLEQYLRAMASDCPQQWVHFLPWAEYCYNTSYHNNIKMSSFQAVYGRLPLTLIPYPLGERYRKGGRTSQGISRGTTNETTYGGRSPEEATWEWLSDFQTIYPTYNLEDKVISEEERIVMPKVDQLGRGKRTKVALAWHNNLHFGRPEFALITGLPFGTVNFGLYTFGELKFRNRVFSHKLELSVTNLDVIGVIEDEDTFRKICDQDSIRVFLILALEVIFMGRLLTCSVDDTLFRLVENLEDWNCFPWGEHIWINLYDEIKNVIEKHSDEHYFEIKKDRMFGSLSHLKDVIFVGLKIQKLYQEHLVGRKSLSLKDLIFYLFAKESTTTTDIGPTIAEYESSWWIRSHVLARERNEEYGVLHFNDEFSSLGREFMDTLNILFQGLIQPHYSNEDISNDFIDEDELRLCLEDEEMMLLQQENNIIEEQRFRLEDTNKMRLEEDKLLQIAELKKGGMSL